jgi:hypothetical protein
LGNSPHRFFKKHVWSYSSAIIKEENFMINMESNRLPDPDSNKHISPSRIRACLKQIRSDSNEPLLKEEVEAGIAKGFIKFVTKEEFNVLKEESKRYPVLISDFSKQKDELSNSLSAINEKLDVAAKNKVEIQVRLDGICKKLAFTQTIEESFIGAALKLVGFSRYFRNKISSLSNDKEALSIGEYSARTEVEKIEKEKGKNNLRTSDMDGKIEKINALGKKVNSGYREYGEGFITTTLKGDIELVPPSPRYVPESHEDVLMRRCIELEVARMALIQESFRRR